MKPSGKPKGPPTAAAAILSPRMIYCFGDFELDGPRFELRCAGKKIRVEPKVLDLLLLLVRHRDRVVLRREVLDALWADVTVSEASIWRVIMEARRALSDELQQVVVTVRGRGFRFAATVTETEGDSQPTPPDRPAPEAFDPTFVGREACIAAIDAKLGEALRGRGGAVWLSGEAGIGKTRTLEEAARRAQLRGATVLTANAHPTPEAPPFWLWAEVIRAHTADRSDSRAREFLLRVAPLLAGEDPTSSGARFALFETVVRYFAEASRDRPVVIVFDDLHWADEPSLRLLEFFARECRKHAVLIVGSYRDAGLQRDGRAHALGGLIGQAGSVAIPLRCLPIDEVVRLVEISSGVAPSPVFARAVLERSGGNPLYIQQLLQTEWAERAITTTVTELASTMDLQQGLIEAISRHLDAMSEAGRELLTLAAVLGKEFETVQLGVVSRLAPEALMDRLDEAVNAHLLLPSSDGRHSFNHVLVRDVLYKRLSSAERAARHRLVGDLLLAHFGDAVEGHAAELAEHFSRALPGEGGDPERAIDMAIRAATQQAELGRPRDAAKHWQQAARAYALLPREDGRRVSVQLGLARARLAAGLEVEARDSFMDAAILARTFAQPEQLAEAALGYAALAGDAVMQRRALLEQAREALAEASDEAGIALRSRVGTALAEA